MKMKSILDTILEKVLGGPFGEVEAQPKDEFGHYTTNVAMRLAKERKEEPRKVAEEIAGKIEAAAPAGLVERIDIAGPGFLNLWLTDAAVREHFAEIEKDKDFWRNKDGGGEKVIVEYSSPNIAKEMHAGHMRNNSLGEALARIHEANGYKVIRWNYLGDWGTQFGKIIAAYKLWGGEVDLANHPVAQLEKLYVRFNEMAKEDPELAKRGQEEFKKLESGDRENRDLWNQFRTASIEEIESIYRRFGIRFDEYIGESFFEEQLEPIIKRLLEKGLAEFSEGAVIIRLEPEGLPVALVRKSDGASLYLTRDIALLEYRVQNYKPKKILHVIGNEQTLQFQQLFAIAGRLGLDQGVDIRHVKYGLLLGANGSKMSTREGTSVSIPALADEAVDRAGKIVTEKNTDMSEGERKEVAETVGIGALKYSMLHEGRTSDIRFDWDKMLDFKGDSGPYLQYTYARLKRLVAKGKEHRGGAVNMDELKTEHELRLMRKMFQLPEEVRRSAAEIITNNITNYLYELANLANRFYEDEHILIDENAHRRAARLLLAATAARVLGDGLHLLGIDVLESI